MRRSSWMVLVVLLCVGFGGCRGMREERLGVMAGSGSPVNVGDVRTKWEVDSRMNAGCVTEIVTKMPAEEAWDYYLKQLQALGWQLEWDHEQAHGGIERSRERNAELVRGESMDTQHARNAQQCFMQLIYEDKAGPCTVSLRFALRSDLDRAGEVAKGVLYPVKLLFYVGDLCVGAEWPSNSVDQFVELFF